LNGKRDIAAGVLGALGITRAVQALGPSPAGSVAILAYHRVFDVPEEDAYPFDIELISASVDAFRRQMDYVARHFRPITFATLLAHLDRGEPPPPRALVVTFDDGFADNYHSAFPVLRERGIPATIFVSTGFIDRQENFWYERVANAVLASRSGRGELPGGEALVLGPDIAARRPAVKRVLSALKQMPDDERRRQVARLVAQFDPAGRCDGDPRSGPLTWDHVREMSAAGIEFGSHSVDHPILSRVDDEGIRREFTESRARIEAVTGRAVQVVAYPVGGPDAFDGRVKAAAREAGYRLGISYVTGYENTATWDPFAIRRLHVERYTGEPLFRAMLAMPATFAG